MNRKSFDPKWEPPAQLDAESLRDEEVTLDRESLRDEEETLTSEALEARRVSRLKAVAKFEFEKALENWGGRNRKPGSW